MCEDDRCMILTAQDRKDIPRGEHPRWTACPARAPIEMKSRYGHRQEGTQYRGVRREVICHQSEVKENPQQVDGLHGRGWSNALQIAILSHNGSSAPSFTIGSPAHEFACCGSRRMVRHARPRCLRGGL